MLHVFDPWLGTWSTDAPGSGVCPGGRAVRYTEELAFERFDAWVRYTEIALEVGTGAVLHQETGVFRSWAPDALELSVVMSSGRLEHGLGAVEAGVVTVESTSFLNDRRGVRAVRRVWAVDGDVCRKSLALSTPAWPELRPHMEAVLHRR